jgi:hypothetical protein
MRGVGLDNREAGRSRMSGGLRGCVQAVKSEAVAAATDCVRGDSLKQKSSLSAPRNAPLRTGGKPGAETALFLYHPYFSGAQRPDGQWI